jgi:hypothetical protein
MHDAFMLVCFGVPFSLLLAVVVLVQIDHGRIRRAARCFPCTRCQTMLGDAAVSLADELWTKHMRTLQERHPDVNFRIIRDLHTVCAQCGARFKFDRAASAPW